MTRRRLTVCFTDLEAPPATFEAAAPTREFRPLADVGDPAALAGLVGRPALSTPTPEWPYLRTPDRDPEDAL